MLAFRFCVVVSAGAIAILGYGANAAARETLPQGETQFFSMGAFAKALPGEPTLTSLFSPEEEPELSGEVTDSAIASQPSTVPIPSQEDPRPGSGATDSSDADSDSSPPSSHPRRERPIANAPQEPQAIASALETTAEPSPPVALSPSLDATHPTPQSILEAFKSAIAANPGITSAEIADAPSPGESPETPTRAALIVESSPSEAPQILEAFRGVMARFEGVEHAIVTEDPIAPERPVSAVASASFQQENFVRFERIFSRFKQANPTPEAAEFLVAEPAIPVPANLLNPRSLLETFKRFAAEPFGEEPIEETSSPSPQTVIEAFANVLKENFVENSTPVERARETSAPFERILSSFNRVAPPSTTATSSSSESPESNSPMEPIFFRSDIADAADSTAWIAESEARPSPRENAVRVETSPQAAVAPANAPPLSAADSEEIQIPTVNRVRVETHSEPVAPPNLAPRLPEADSILAAFADAIAPNTTVDRASVEVIPSPPSPSIADSDISDSESNVNPGLTQASFTPFERILNRFRTYTSPQIPSPIAGPDPIPVEPEIEPEIVQSNPGAEGRNPNPRSLLDAFQETILNPPPPNAEAIPLPELEPAPPPPPQPEIEEAIPNLPPTTPIPTQPAAVLGELEPPNPLHSSGNPLLFPTQPEEVQIDIRQPITLLQALELAQRNNPTLETARIQLDLAREALREALAAEYPTLSTQFDVTRTDSAQQELSDFSRNPQLANLNDSISTSTNAQLELSYNLLTGGRRTAQIRAAEERVRLNQLGVERQNEQTRFEVTRAYYNLQEADARVDIEQAAVEDARRTLRDAQLLEQAGLGTRFDVLRAEVDLANSQQNLTTAVSQQLTSRRELAVFLALPQDAIVTTADEIERAGEWELSLEETIISAYQNRAELEQQLVQRDISEQQRQVALSAIRPQVNLFANYNILGIIDDDRDLADGYSVGARLQWTLFDGGAARARAAQEEKNIALAEARFDEQLDQIRLEVEQAYNTLRANEENIETANIALQLAQESLRLARLRFSAGVGTQTEVINAQTELTRARGNLLTAIISYNQSLAALQRAVSNLPDNRLFDLP
jgi:outer membrane protein TolC